MTQMLRPTLEVILKRHYKNNCIYKVLRADSELATKKGDNFTSELTRVKLDVLLNSGKRTKDSVMIKEELQNDFAKIMYRNMNLYPKEISVYRDILPHLEDIMLEYGDRTGPLWGKCIDYKPYNLIVLDDLAKYGYIMVDRTKGLDWKHSELVVRGLAKFHAITAILYQKGLINMDIYQNHIYSKENTSLIRIQRKCYEMLAREMETKWGTGWKAMSYKIRDEIVPNINKLIKKLTEFDKSKFNALCHGDFWVNNVLFKYGLDGVTPISIKLLDFQQSYFNSPAFDLKHFLATSISMELRNVHENRLTQMYYDSLMKELESYKYDGPAINSLKEFEEEMKRLDLYGLTVQLIVLPIVLIKNKTEMPNLQEMIKNIKNNKEVNFTFNPYKHSLPVFSDVIKATLATCHNRIM
ncbi:hypothetical protein O3M35_001075 [Rhynocoris fuscipes]|uniref:CHK kinase-like domain-containing protein n=1 Tax=Rhynocoris fuscipes TaxID=488301 RepID=A0AAW1DS08_9HEMI